MLRDYTKDLDKIKVNKAAMDGTIRGPTNLIEEARPPGMSDSKPREPKPNGIGENQWGRKNDVEMADGQNEIYEPQIVSAFNRRTKALQSVSRQTI